MNLQQSILSKITNKGYSKNEFLSNILICKDRALDNELKSDIDDMYFFAKYLFSIEIDVERFVYNRSLYYNIDVALIRMLSNKNFFESEFIEFLVELINYANHKTFKKRKLRLA